MDTSPIEEDLDKSMNSTFALCKTCLDVETHPSGSVTASVHFFCINNPWQKRFQLLLKLSAYLGGQFLGYTGQRHQHAQYIQTLH